MFIWPNKTSSTCWLSLLNIFNVNVFQSVWGGRCYWTVKEISVIVLHLGRISSLSVSVTQINGKKYRNKWNCKDLLSGAFYTDLSAEVRVKPVEPPWRKSDEEDLIRQRTCPACIHLPAGELLSPHTGTRNPPRPQVCGVSECYAACWSLGWIHRLSLPKSTVGNVGRNEREV